MNPSQTLATYNPRVTPVIKQQKTQGFSENALALGKTCCQQTITNFHLQWICPELHVFPTHPWRKDRNIHDRYNMFNMISGWWYTYPSEKYELVSWDI